MRAVIRIPAGTVRSFPLAALLAGQPALSYAAPTDLLDVTDLLELIDEDEEVTEVLRPIGARCDEEETVRGVDVYAWTDEEPTIRQIPAPFAIGLREPIEDVRGASVVKPVKVTGGGLGGGPSLREILWGLLRRLLGLAR